MLLMLRAVVLVVYWLLFAVVAVGAMVERPIGSGRRSSLPLICGGVVIALLVGLRFEVGGDWLTYQRIYALAQYATLDQALARGDPAYQFLNWTVYRVGGGIVLVNLVCGAIFAWGLIRFALTQKRPWSVVLVAVPYLVIVVAMGFTRQAVAIAILMAGLAALLRGASIPRFTIYVIFAALFHKTAIVVLLLVLLSARRNLFLNLLFVLAAIGVLYDSLLAESVDKMIYNYIEARYSSQGATVRVAMSLLPAALFLVARKRFAFAPDEDKLWRNFSYAAFLLAVMLVVLPSSTVVDRLALYVLPLQLAIVARIPDHVLKGGVARALVISYAFAIQYVWLNYAAYSYFWIPYKFYPFAA